MASNAPNTGAPARAPSEYLDDASCWLEQASGIADLIAVSDSVDTAASLASYGVSALIKMARDAIQAGYPRKGA